MAGDTRVFSIMQWAAASLRTGARAAIDVVLPTLCLGCAAPVSGAGGLCAACWRGFEQIARPFCDRLGSPMSVDLGPGVISPRAIAAPPHFSRQRAVARYDGTARTLVHRLKYSDRLDLVGAMGGWMARAGADLLATADVIVPVPLHRSRLWSRRFNQASELSRAIAAYSGVPVAHEALLRVKATRPQFGLSAGERARNIAGAFRVNERFAHQIAGRRVVLVDDVATTGSTMNAAARALRRAHAADVDALVFALVADPV